MFRMINPVREYEWGSTTAFSELFGWAASTTPRAEIWMGAHPGDPSSLELSSAHELTPIEVTSLPDYLRASDQGREGFPFLLKVLAAEQPLSIQAHPTVERARLGFAAEETAGIALDAPHRSYKDPNAKPELIVALTEFSALCGFRPYAESAAVLDALASAVAGLRRPAACRQLPVVLERLQGFVAAQDYRGAVEQLLRSERAGAESAAEELRRLLDPGAGSEPGGDAALGASLDPNLRQMLEHVSAAFPADPGIFVTLLLNSVRLQPGESIYLPAGNLHAYLHGVGVELMGNSDNVLRGGLTTKHLAVDELLSATDFGVLPVPHCPVQRSGAAPLRIRYQAPFEQFQLEQIQFPGEVELEQPGHGIVLCTAGELTLHAPTGHTGASGTPRMLTLTPGESAFLSPTTGHRLSASAHASAFVASTTLARQDQEHPRT